jgi:phage shock protein A
MALNKLFVAGYPLKYFQGSLKKGDEPMGFIKRIQRLTVSRIESFLSAAEDPEILFPQLVKEMEDQVRAATDAEAKAMVSVKGSERDLKQVADKLERMVQGAQLAMDGGDEDTAREAIEAQMSLEQEVERKTENLKRAESAHSDAREARKQIQQQLDEVRMKKDEILARARITKTQKKVQQTVHGPVSSAKSILDSVAQMEAKVDETEAQLEVQREISAGGKSGASLEKRLAELETNAGVEERLAALKKKVKGSDAS